MARSLKNPTIYEIYPRSFRDTTGTGEGDLRGVIDNLGHVRDLGVDAVWLAPFYVSPMDDGGYDIADHRAVDPRFGTLDDVDALIETAHGMGLGVIFDLVFNHTSCEHPNFLAAIDGDEDAAARYVWRDPKPDGTAPNNWLSFFGQPAWTWNHKRRQYYFHQFLSCQPSLDLRHGPVQDDHRETVEFWCARGVDGFRMDAITSYLFDTSMKDNPPASPEVKAKVSGADFNPYTWQDHVYDMLPGDGAAFGATVRDWAGPDKWIVGENNSGNRAIELSRNFTHEGRLDAAYPLLLGEGGGDPRTYADLIARMDGDWIAPWWLSNHDVARHVSAHGDGTAQAAKFFALLLSVLPGSLMLFQGEELGLPHPTLSKEATRDPHDLLYWPDGPGRDGARVPLPWDDGPNGGFSSGTPWLPMGWPAGLSVAAQDSDPQSVLSFYRRVLALRGQAGFPDPDTVSADVEGAVLRLAIEAGGASWRGVFDFGDRIALPEDGETIVEVTGPSRFAARLSRV
ncbi:alpha-amylase [Maribius pontilimi]|uniref:Alpha-amylase n=1 Tax=Palleronia pontilimi TaxID=1964209 RepID=A0A934IA07_9RHOB|nr:alpha-amylase family glycosyl hydrolase [Palleronia pontilimi]MBJ3763254.1 alpha-amylase [Palleronia pontilimi]